MIAEIAALSDQDLKRVVEYFFGVPLCVSPGQGRLTDEELASLSDDELNLMLFQGMTVEEAIAGRSEQPAF